MAKVRDKYGNWIFIVPVAGVSIKKSINEEIRINRVLFVSRKKLPRIRKRLKIPVPINEIINKDKSDFVKSLFKDSSTYAVLIFTGSPSQEFENCKKIIENELNILSLSQLGFSKRKHNSRLSIGSDLANNISTLTINKDHNEFDYSSSWDTYSYDFIVEKPWKTFHKNFYYFDLLKILRGEILVSNHWLKTISRAAYLIGKSQSTNDVSTSFIWNMIALEMLLIGEGGNTEETLVERSRFLLDWSKDWDSNDFEAKIRSSYKKRNDYVHSGYLDLITREDLIFTDDWAFNVLNNLVRMHKYIKSKFDLMDLSKKYQAERILGIKSSRFQNGRLNMVSRKYTEQDFREF